MTSAQNKLRNAALLRNLTDIKAITGYQTRWTGTCAMIKRFLGTRSELIEVDKKREGIYTYE